MVKIVDVARKAGVSAATVSRVLNNPNLVAEETVTRVQKVIEELRYVPHLAARSMKIAQTRTLGLIIPHMGGFYFAPLLEGIEEAVHKNGYELLVFLARYVPQTDLPRSLGLHNTDGLLVFSDMFEPGVLTYCQQHGFPMVLIHQTPPSGLKIPYVTIENKAASRRLVEHLIVNHRRKRIVLLKGPRGIEDARLREEGYRLALETMGLPVDPQLILPGEFDPGIAELSIRHLVKNGIQFDAVFAGDDNAAQGAMEALRVLGIKVPEDVAVVGFNDMASAAYLNPSLTTVRAPTRQVGYEAAIRLLGLIQKEDIPLHTVLPVETIFRRSCGCERVNVGED
jgi:DNA-binding LacI/PurR family transcriptional regulator